MEIQSQTRILNVVPTSPIKFFCAALFIFALIGISFSAVSVSLDQPTSNSLINTQFIRFSWIPAGFGATPQCVLEISGPISVRQSGISCSNGLTCDTSVTDLPDGAYSWNVTCNDGNQGASSAPRAFTVFRPEIPITCLLGLPENGARFPDTAPVPNVLFTWNVTGFQSAYDCMLRIGTTYNTISFSDSATERSYQATLAKGTYAWDMRCYNSTRSVNCLPSRSFSVVSMVLLFSPQNNFGLDRWFVDFSWKPVGLSNPTCTLNLNGINVVTKSCTNNVDCIHRIKDLPDGNYNWYVSCTSGAETASSDTWSFLISRPPSTGVCSLWSPANGVNIGHTPTIDYLWNVSGFPSQHECEIIVDGSSHITPSSSLESEVLNLPLSPGSHNWQVYCYDYNYRINCGQRTFTAIPRASLSSPANGETTSAFSNNFTWDISGFTATPSCTLYVNGASRGSKSCAGECGIVVSSLPEGDLPWNVNCVAANGESASSASWIIKVNYTAISLLQSSPVNNSLIPRSYANFIWSYSGFGGTPTCTMNLNGTSYGSPSCTAGGVCNKTITGLREGKYAWNVTCSYGSQVRTTGKWQIEVRYSLSVDPVWPIGIELGSLSNAFFWTPSGFDASPSCTARIYSSSGALAQASVPISCANGAQCSYLEYNLPNGNYLWNVTCNYSIQNKSSATNPFTIKYSVYCAAIFPYASQTSRAMVNDFSFNYSGFEGTPACTMILNGVGYAPSCNTVTRVCNKTFANMLEGAYTWSGQCSYLSQQASTGNQQFSIVYSLPITLISPINDTTTSLYSNTFLWGYAGFDSLPACTLYLDGATQGVGTCNFATKQCTKDISNLAPGAHTWYVYCQNGNQKNQSATNSLRIDYSAACTLSSPQEGNISRSANMNFSWSPSGFAGNPVSCTLYLKGPISVTRTIPCTSDLLCYTLVTDLPQGAYLWNATCWYGNQKASSPETRSFSVGYNLPIQLSYPAEGSIISLYSNTFSWVAFGFDGSSVCTAKVYDRTSGALYSSSSSVQCANGATCSADFQNLPTGDYAWNVSCSKNLQANASRSVNFKVDYSALSVSLVSPPSGQSQSSSNTFVWSYFGFAPYNPNCYLYVNGAQYPVSCTSSPCSKTVASMVQGTYLWNATCTYGNMKATSPETRGLAIAYNLDVALNAPTSGEIVRRYAKNFTWTPSGFDSLSSCTIRVYNTTSASTAFISSASCVSGAQCKQEVSNLKPGSYLWNVTCQLSSFSSQNKSSLTYPFTVQYDSQVDVTINSPPAPPNPILSNYTNTIFWNASNFDCAQPTCSITINNTFNMQVFTASKLCTSNSMCSQLVSNLAEGSYSAWVSCACSNQAALGSTAFSIDYDSSLTLLSPANNNQSLVSSMNFTWNYTRFGATPACTIYLDNISYSSTCNSQNCSYYAPTVAQGAHTWNVTCRYNNQNASSETRSFIVGFVLSVPLVSPGLGNPTLIDYSNNFTWATSGFDADPTCTMGIYKSGTPAAIYTFAKVCAKNSACNNTVQNLQEVDYLWNVTCKVGIQNASSLTNTFKVDYASAVALVSPGLGNPTLTNYSNNFIWNASSFEANPTCNFSIYKVGTPVPAYSSSLSCVKNSQCSQIVQNLPEADYLWNVTCIYNNQNAFSLTNTFKLDYDSALTLLSPANGNVSAASSMNFTWNYTRFGATPVCTIYIDNISYSSTCNSQNCSYYAPVVAQGAHTWNVTCKYNNQNASSEVRTFIVGFQLLVSLISPGSGNPTIIDYSNNFSWVPSGFDTDPACTISIYKFGTALPVYTFSKACTKNSQCNNTVQNLQEADYLWNVTCKVGIQNASSLTNTFKLDYDSSLTLLSPANNNQSLVSSMNFTWNYTRFGATPACTIYLDNISYSSTCNSQNCSYYAPTVAQGAHTWNVTCRYNNQNASSETWSFIVGFVLSVPLVSPGLGNPTLIDYSNNFTWATSGFDADPTCTMGIYKSGTPAVIYTFAKVCTKNSACNNTVQNLQEADYLWNVTCKVGIQNASSMTNTFKVDYDSACTLGLPPDTYSTSASSVNFSWYYSRFYAPPACALIINGVSSLVSCTASPCNKSVTGMAENSYIWGVNCTYKNQTAVCPETRGLTIGYALSTSLVSPGPGAGLTKLSNNFIWIPSGFDANPQCTLKIYNSSTVVGTYSSLSCSNGVQCIKQVDSLYPGDYSWNVNCTSGIQQKMSETRTFTVAYSNSVVLNTPLDGETTNLYTIPFVWGTTGFEGSPTCKLYVDSIMKISLVNSTYFTYSISNFVEGSHTWYVECAYGIQKSTSAARTFTVSYSGLSCGAVSPPDNTEIQNQSMRFTWLASGFAGNPTCTLRVRNATILLSSTPACTNGVQCFADFTNQLAESDYSWFVNCTFNNQKANCAQRSLLVRYQLSVWQVSPSDGVELFNYTNSVSWQAAGFDSAPRCMANVYTQAGALAASSPASPGVLCAPGIDCSSPFSNLAEGQYSWNVTCSNALQKYTSITRKFNIKYNSTVGLYLPNNNGAIRASTDTGPVNTPLYWDTVDFSAPPTCAVSIYNSTGTRIAYLSKLCPATGRCNQNVSLSFGNNYVWNVTCSNNNQKGASETRMFSVLPSSASCVLDSPANGAAMPPPYGTLPNVYFQWQTYGFESTHGCNLSINGMNTVVPYSNDQGQGVYQVLPAGSYSWKVSCYNSSDSVSCGTARSLTVSRAVSLFMPVNGTKTAAYRINFSWMPLGFNTTLNTTCVLQVLGQTGFSYSSSAICSQLGKTCAMLVSGLPMDTYAWSVTCSNTKGETAKSASNSFVITQSQSPFASCTILFPSDNSTMFNTKPIYSWSLSGMQNARSCALIVDGAEAYASLENMDTIYTYVSPLSLSYGSHTWKVICSNDLESATCAQARFNISRYVQIMSPANAASISTWVSNFSWQPIGFTGYSSCAIKIYNSTSAIFSNSVRCAASGNCYQAVTGLLPGSYNWNVTCSNSTLGQYGSSTESSVTITRSKTATCALVSPLDGEVFPNRSIVSPNVNYTWNVSGFSSQHACIVTIDGANISIPSSSVTRHSLPSIAEVGFHTWEALCYDATETATCGSAKFEVGTKIVLRLPSANATINTWAINFTWVPAGFKAMSSCFLNIDGMEYGNRGCMPNQPCSESNIHMDVGDHAWSVSCVSGSSQITSQTNEFKVIMPVSSASCTLINPVDGADLQATHGETTGMTYSWDAMGFMTSHSCDRIINSRVYLSGVWSLDTRYYLDTALDPGSYMWSIVCYNGSIYTLCGPWSFTVTDIPAELAVKSPLPDSSTNSASVLFSWLPYNFIATPTCTLKISGAASQQTTVSCVNNADCESRVPLSEGTYQWSVNCIRNLVDGTSKNANSGPARQIKVDRTPPISSITGSNSAGAYNFGEPSEGNVQVSIQCADGLSGCDKTYYCLAITEGCTPSSIYSGSLSVSQSGYFVFYSMDKAGNAEDSQSVLIHIKTDFTAPKTLVTAKTSTSNYGFGQTSYDPVTVTAQCSDPDSGCASTLYCIGDSNCVPNQVYSDPIVFSEYGNKYIRVYSKDLDNNFENPVQTLLVIYSPPPPPPAGVSGCTTYTASSYNIVPVAGVLAACIVGLAFMLSQNLQNPQLEAWAKNEWKELIIAGLTVGLVYSAALVMTHDINGILTGQGDRDTLISFADSKFTAYRTALIEDYRMTIIVANRIGILTSYSYTSSFGGYSIYFGQNAAPYSGAGSLVSMLNGLAGNISNGIMVYDAMILFMRFFFCASYQMILPLGFALRMIPFTRKIGGTLIALALGGIFIYPFSMVLTATIHENIGVQHSMITSGDLDLITIKLSNILVMLCTNDYIRFFTSLSEWGWWVIICTPYCIMMAWAGCPISSAAQAVGYCFGVAAIAASKCLTGYAACFFAEFGICYPPEYASNMAYCIPETFWECYMPLTGSCWTIAENFYLGVQKAVQLVGVVVAVASSESIKNAVQGDLGVIYDTVVDHLVIPVANVAVLPIMEAVLVGGLTIVGTRGLSAALNGDISLSGLERLI